MSELIDKHSDYSNNIEVWERCRAVVAGQDAIHAGGVTYLSKLDAQTDDGYAAYKSRARFFNASDRTVQGMSGLVFRKPVSVSPDDLDFIDDVSHQGVSLSDYSKDVLRELLIIGRCGTLVDYPPLPENTSMAQAEKLNASPTWAMYTSENIYSWTFKYVNNVYQLTRVLLYDGVLEDEGDETEYYRELLLEDGVYTQKLYERTDDDDEPKLINTIIPKMNNSALPYIPFYIHVSSGKQTKIPKPPLLDLFDTNIKHYQLKADHAHALHYVALPTPYVTGVSAQDAPTTIGPERIWALPDVGASVGILEFTGSGIGAIADELDKIESHMAQLGSRLLAPETNVQETATATAIKSMGENSTLADIVDSINAQLSMLWRFTLKWLKIEDDESFIALNKDFLPSVLSGNDLIALVTAWQSGAISKPTLFDNLKKGEVIAPNVEYEQEEQAIDEDLGNIDDDEDLSEDEGDIEEDGDES